MKAKKVWFDDVNIYVLTDEDKQAEMPLKWFPKLLHAATLERENFELWADGEWIHWEKIGEDLGVEGFFNFKKELAQNFRPKSGT